MIRIDPASLRRLMAAETDLSDILFAAFVARREVLRGGADATAIRIIGSRYSATALALRSFARRRRLAHTFIDLDDPDIDDIDVLLDSLGVRRRDTPVVITPTAVLRNPTVGELADHLGFTYRTVEGRVYDVVVVGAGPGGLAAAVYGASEGLDTLVLDCGRPRRPGRHQLAHRELLRLPRRRLGRRPGRTGDAAGDAARRDDQRPVLGCRTPRHLRGLRRDARPTASRCRVDRW